MSDKQNDACDVNSNLESFLDLKRRVEITKDARFQANLRLERRNKYSYFIIAVLSLFVIIISLVPNIFELPPAGSQALLSLSIINSVFIIITTFLEASGNFVHRGEQLHRSARKISKVFNKIILLTPEEKFNKQKINELQEEYQSALDDCPFNHENIDYDLIKATKPSLFKGRIYDGDCNWIVVRWRRLKYKTKEFMWTFPHIVVFLGTLLSLWWIIFENGLGQVSLRMR